MTVNENEAPMIDIRNVSKWYGSFQVLKNCSTSVRKGEVVVVCGPSGSGKSTLIKTVNGLEPVQQGMSERERSEQADEYARYHARQGRWRDGRGRADR